MKKLIEISLGIVTSVGGFLEIGSITTAAQAGAGFGFQLAWVVVLGTLCIAFLVEMSGRFSACSKHTIPDAMRERFGVNFFAITLAVLLGVTLLVLAAEEGGIAAALEMATGWPIPAWATPVAILAWLLLWRGTFGFIENGVSALGLVTIAFAVGAAKMHPDYHAVMTGMVPSLPTHDRVHYWFVAVSVLGASITPSLYYFYSSGAIEDKWDASYVGVNRVIAAIGMGFGGFLSLAVLVLGALVFHPKGVEVQHYQQLPELLTGVFGRKGFWLVVASLGIACLGATVEIALALAYTIAQGFGWRWGEDLEPHDDARFSLTYTLLIAAAALFVLFGVDPLKLTEISMALTAASLPVGVFPFLILMNDREYLGEHTNGFFGNAVVMVISGLAAVLAVVSIPLQLAGG
ncbi:MAG: natural resistance-associated macrophage protein [Gemmatimonadetes bacterium]|nr:natural resistance-associated macrophage protein [Gemmatimonadota bacterium]